MRFIATYGNCLVVGGSSEGLYLAIMALFRFRHPPLLIPWTEIAVTRQCIVFRKVVRFELGRELDIPLYLHPKLADKLKDAVGESRPERMD
ncbi:MAG: hypothetical protein ACRD4I_02870 [Candidatus Angelobacter sp.]